MSYTEVIYAIGDAATESFEILRKLGSGLPFGWFNWTLIVIGVGLMGWWLVKMSKSTEDFEENRPS